MQPRNARITLSGKPMGLAKCQKCLQEGHWTYDCKNESAYKYRPSRTAILQESSLKPGPTTTVDPEPYKEKESKKRKTVGPETSGDEEENEPSKATSKANRRTDSQDSADSSSVTTDESQGSESDDHSDLSEESPSHSESEEDLHQKALKKSNKAKYNPKEKY